MFKEHEQFQRNSMNDIAESLGKLTTMFNDHLLFEKKEELDRVKKRQSLMVTSIWGLASAIFLMVVGTFWDMFIFPIIEILTGGGD